MIVVTIVRITTRIVHQNRLELKVLRLECNPIINGEWSSFV